MVLVRLSGAPSGPGAPSRVFRLALSSPASADDPPMPWIEFDFPFASLPLPHDHHHDSSEEVLSYTIRCDVSTIDLTTLPIEFKQKNALYPIGGTPVTARTKLEKERNEVAWALTVLNPILQRPKPEKLGLLYWAVEYWMVARECVDRVAVASASYTE